MAKRIGLIGGLALRAGLFYYEQLVRRHAALQAPQPLELVLNHADVTRVLAHVSAGQKTELGTYLGTLANQLFRAGADLVGITAIAPHVAIRETIKVANGPMVNVLDTLAAGLRNANLKRVAVFGNRVVMQTGILGALSADASILLEPSLMESVHEIYTNIALHGKQGTPPETDLLQRAARHLIDDCGAEAIVFAGTDLSSFYAKTPPGYPFLDLAQLHLDEIMRRLAD